MNSIPQIQNQPQQLQRLAAQRQLYADAKRLLALQMFATTVVSVLLAFLSVKSPGLRVWGALWGLSFTSLDVFFLTPWQKTRKKTASTIQEMFDCEVLQLPWKRGREKVEMEEVVAAARRHEERIGHERFLKNFKDWYAMRTGNVKLPVARILCQRSNVRWDANLRNRYNFALWCLTLVVLVALLAYGLKNDLRVEELLTTVVLPLQPLLVLFGRQIQENRESIDTLNRLKRVVKKLWDDALNNTDPEALLQGSRDLQDELWDLRSKNPLLFGWVYNLFKSRDEDDMNIGVDALVEEARGKACAE